MTFRVKTDISAVVRVRKAFTESALLAGAALQKPLIVLGSQLSGVVRKYTPHDTGQLKRSLTKQPIIKTTVSKYKLHIEAEVGFSSEHAKTMEEGFGPGQAQSWQSQRKGLERWVGRRMGLKNKKGNPQQTRVAFLIWQKHMNEGLQVPLKGPGKNTGMGAMLKQADKDFGSRLRSQVSAMSKKITEAIIKRAAKHGR